MMWFAGVTLTLYATVGVKTVIKQNRDLSHNWVNHQRYFTIIITVQTKLSAECALTYYDILECSLLQTNKPEQI